ncbi:hypothetical protein GOBAR_DD36809 [Gossypium barbadense]|nr:hypothetical protein GOBAR_DD36809 [Gossypium barbadense]
MNSGGGSMLLASNCRAALLFINSPCCNRTQGVRSGSCAAYLSQMELWMCCRPFSIPCPSGADVAEECYLVDPASSHMLVSKIKPCMFKKLVVGLRGGSAGPPHGEHRCARPYYQRCAPGLNWPGRSSGTVTLKKLECSKQAYACGGAWPFLIGGAICLVNSVNERDLSLLTSYTEVILRG